LEQGHATLHTKGCNSFVQRANCDRPSRTRSGVKHKVDLVTDAPASVTDVQTHLCNKRSASSAYHKDRHRFAINRGARQKNRKVPRGKTENCFTVGAHRLEFPIIIFHKKCEDDDGRNSKSHNVLKTIQCQEKQIQITRALRVRRRVHETSPLHRRRRSPRSVSPNMMLL